MFDYSQMSINKDIIKETFKLVRKDKSIRTYAVIESLVGLPTSILFYSFLIFVIYYVFLPWQSRLVLLERILSNNILIGALIFLGVLAVILIPISFYIHQLFRIASLYNAYSILNGQKPSFSYGIENAKGKIWRCIISRIKGGLIAGHLSFQQSKEGIRTGKYPSGKLIVHDTMFLIPIILFENKNLEDAVVESSKLYTKDFKEILKSQYRLGFIYGIAPFLMFILLASFFAYHPSVLLIITALIVTSLIGSIIGAIQSYASPIFLVVSYYYVKHRK